MIEKDFYKLLYVVVTGDPTEEEDTEVPGIYIAGVEPELSEGDQREAALDQFHDHVGIGMLEDFRIIVADEDGNILQAPDDYENGTHSDKAEFRGAVNMDETPETIRALASKMALDFAP